MAPGIAADAPVLGGSSAQSVVPLASPQQSLNSRAGRAVVIRLRFLYSS
jgi:hypothetical protein